MTPSAPNTSIDQIIQSVLGQNGEMANGRVDYGTLLRLQAESAAIGALINQQGENGRTAATLQQQTALQNAKNALDAQIAQLQASTQTNTANTQSATQLQTSQNQLAYNYSALNQAEQQFAQQFGLNNQEQAFQQNLQTGQFGLSQQGQAFNQALSSAQFQAQQAQFNANYYLDRDKFNTQTAQSEQQFNSNFGLQEDQFAFQKEQAARQLASNPFDTVNYLMYLSGMAASPIGTQPGYSGINDQFNRYPLTYTSPLTNQAPGILGVSPTTSGAGISVSPTIQSAGSVGDAATAALKMASGGPFSNIYQPGAPSTAGPAINTPAPGAVSAPTAVVDPETLAKLGLPPMTGDQISAIVKLFQNPQATLPAGAGVAYGSPKGPPPDNPVGGPAIINGQPSPDLYNTTGQGQHTTPPPGNYTTTFNK